MGVMSWASKLFNTLISSVKETAVGVARTVLRGIVSASVKLEERLPDIQETMHKMDPGQIYADWVSQYRASMQGTDQEKNLAMWPSDLPFNESVMTQESFRRARKYRYVFSGQIENTKTGVVEWKMFSMYSNDIMSPDDIKRQFEWEYFKDRYENSIHLNQLIVKRVQRWTGKLQK